MKILDLTFPQLFRYLRMWWNDLVYAWDTYHDARAATKRRYFSKESK